VRELHDAIIAESGGLSGEHSERLLGACARPFQTAFGEPLFVTKYEQAAALMHGVVSGHVFADGNKRTSVAAVAYFLGTQDILRSAPRSLEVRLLGELAIEVASTKMSVEEVAFWIERILEPR
jgi:death-on-curing protein